jgi:molybdopterin molybdotransferase
MVETMITVDEALDRIFTRIPTPLPETVPLNRAHKRVLLTPLLAKHTQPPFDASAMDGYAVRAAEIEPG